MDGDGSSRSHIDGAAAKKRTHGSALRVESDPSAAASDAYNSTDYLLFSTVTPDFGAEADVKREHRKLHSGMKSTVAIRAQPTKVAAAAASAPDGSGPVAPPKPAKRRATPPPSTPPRETIEPPAPLSVPKARISYFDNLSEDEPAQEDGVFEVLFRREQ